MYMYVTITTSISCYYSHWLIVVYVNTDFIFEDFFNFLPKKMFTTARMPAG